MLTTHMEKRKNPLPRNVFSQAHGKKHAASLTPGDGVHAADASVVRPAPVGFGLLFGRIGPEPSFMAEGSWKSKGCEGYKVVLHTELRWFFTIC